MKLCKKCNKEKTGNHNSYCKECNVARVLEWRANNKEKYNLKQKEYSKVNNKKRTRSWEKQNKDKIKEQKRRWVLKNKEKVNQKARETDRKRRAQKQANGFIKYSEQEVLSLYGENCSICNIKIDLKASRKVGKPGWEKGLHIDHVIPISLGGPDTIENVRPAHGKCNLVKHQKVL